MPTTVVTTLEKPLRTRITPVVEVRCDLCGGRYGVSDRRARAIRAEGTISVCPDCRRPPRPRPGPADYAFWTSRFSMDEIRLLACAIFGPWNA